MDVGGGKKEKAKTIFLLRTRSTKAWLLSVPPRRFGTKYNKTTTKAVSNVSKQFQLHRSNRFTRGARIIVSGIQKSVKSEILTDGNPSCIPTTYTLYCYSSEVFMQASIWITQASCHYSSCTQHTIQCTGNKGKPLADTIVCIVYIACWSTRENG